MASLILGVGAHNRSTALSYLNLKKKINKFIICKKNNKTFQPFIQHSQNHKNLCTKIVWQFCSKLVSSNTDK